MIIIRLIKYKYKLYFSAESLSSSEDLNLDIENSGISCERFVVGLLSESDSTLLGFFVFFFSNFSLLSLFSSKEEENDDSRLISESLRTGSIDVSFNKFNFSESAGSSKLDFTTDDSDSEECAESDELSFNLLALVERFRFLLLIFNLFGVRFSLLSASSLSEPSLLS